MNVEDDVDYQFHARQLLQNPAFRRALADERDAIAREMHRLSPWQREERWAVSVALTTLENLERRWRKMTQGTGRIEQFSAQQRESA